MIQHGSRFKVVDNSGAKIAYCIKVSAGYKRRYAKIGDIITVSIKDLRLKRRAFSKVKKGEIYKAIVIRTRSKVKKFNGDFFSYFENSVVLLNKKKKFVGTRIFGAIPKILRYTKYLKLVSLSNGVNF